MARGAFRVACADAHCHLQDLRIWESRERLLRAAWEAGVEVVSVCGCDAEDWGRVEALERECRSWDSVPHVIPSFGLHPYRVGAAEEGWLEKLRGLLEEHASAGLGECGLDKSPHVLSSSPWEVQVRAFEAQLALADELDRPVTVHCVRAHGALLECLSRCTPRGGVLLHSWSGSPEMMRALAKLGCIFSFSGALCNEKARKIHESAKVVPPEQLVVETDSPDQTPPLHAGLNQPANVPTILTALADARNSESVEALAELTKRTTMRFFRVAA